MEKLLQGEKVLFDLGYKKEITNNSIFYYQKNGVGERYGFDFDKDLKEVTPYLENKENEAIYMTMEELNAIYLICIGMGWLEIKENMEINLFN